MKKIKIVNIVSRLEYGGVESVVLNYIKNMDKKDIFEFHVITQDINAKGCVKQFLDEGVKVHIITHKRKNILKNIYELYKILKSENFDIVHSHMNLLNFYALYLAKICGVNVRISHIHSALKANNLIKQIIYSVLKRLNILFANYYFACGYEAGLFLYGKKMIESQKVVFINNAIETNFFKYDQDIREKIRLKYDISESTLVIGHIGRFIDVKNHVFILDILNSIKSVKKNIKLILVGSGELFDSIKKKVHDMNMDQYVIFVGNTNKAYLYYSAMDIFILPSIYEGLPVVSIEAQCSDLPCFFSDQIDQSCKIIDSVQFLPINKGADIWKNEIMNYQCNLRNKNVINDIINAGYDIKVEANRLKSFYIKSLEI